MSVDDVGKKGAGTVQAGVRGQQDFPHAAFAECAFDRVAGGQVDNFQPVVERSFATASGVPKRRLVAQ
ncbi:MAG: hypothetical protein ABGZ53_08025 [Fuerstiella sp.]